MIENIVIVGFVMSVFFYFAFLKLYDLRKEIKVLEKQKLNCQFRRCYYRGKLKAYRELQ